MSKLSRTIPVAVVAALGLTVATSQAGAAVTIGQTANPAVNCGVFDRLQQTVISGTGYVVPPTLANGIITSWSTQAGASVGPLGMKVFRNISGNTYQVVGHDGPQPLTPNQLNTFPTNVAVQAGDVLGNFTPPPTTTGPACTFAVTGEFYIRRADNLADGSQGNFSLFAGDRRLNVSAVVEPDCDNDGLGDETQDTDLSSCAPPPPGTPPGPGIPPPGSPPGTPPVTCGGLNATIVGTNGNDVRTGSQGRDVIAGLGGNDTLSGIGGNDVICGGAGKDTLRGGKGKDRLFGQAGKDTLRGGGGKDKCIGGKGNDTASKCEVEKSI